VCWWKIIRLAQNKPSCKKVLKKIGTVRFVIDSHFTTHFIYIYIYTYIYIRQWLNVKTFNADDPYSIYMYIYKCLAHLIKAFKWQVRNNKRKQVQRRQAPCVTMIEKDVRIDKKGEKLNWRYSLKLNKNQSKKKKKTVKRMHKQIMIKSQNDVKNMHRRVTLFR